MKKVPELKNELLEDAKEILDKSGIPYEENEEREFSLTVRRGRVIRTEPKENEEIRNDEKVTIYVSKLWLLPFILIFILLLLLSIVMGIGVSKIYSNNRPIIESTYQGWVQKNVVYVKKDANVSEIDTYFYCVTKSKRSNKCEWKETKTKNTLLSESGKWNVFFKARYKNGKYSYISNRKEVLIDNNAPIIDSITKKISSNSFSFDIKARDLESGIKSYSYKIGNKGYIEVDNKFTISKLNPNTEYTISIKIEDNAGNVYEVTFTEKTKDKSSTTTPDNNENDDKTTSNSNEESTTNDNTTTTTKGEGNTNTTKSTKTTNKTTTTDKTKPAEPVVEIPKIDLNDLPSEFEYGEDYKLPSHVEFGPSGGTYSCALDHDWSINVESTKDFAVGKYTVSCKAVSNTGSYAEVSKDIKVNVPTGEDEEWDGWIRLNLYYPKESVNREWRLHREGEIRGEDDDWQPYTGPILVKVSDLENIYIRYDIDGEKRIDVPTGKVLVDIQANKLSLKGDETTKVNILFDKNAITKEYRINGSDWREYTSEFNVAADTLIEARATREENVYDDDGKIIMTKTLVGSDALYISEIKDSEGNGTVDFGTVNIEIKADKTILTGNEKTNVEIEYEENSTSRMYKIDNSPWLEYTGIFTVSANQTIYASATKQKSITLSDGTVRNGIASGKVKKTILSESNPIEETNLNVDIKAYPSKLLKDELSSITIISNEVNSRIYYSLDNDNYKEYLGTFEVGANTTIYAYAELDGKRAYDRRYIGSITVPDRLEGPVISINPTSTVEKTTVTITTKEEAKNIYYSFDGGVYKTYTEPFEVTKNGIVRAYYIRSDNKKSETSYYYVQNIRGKNKPYVRIDAKPSIYLSEDIKMVEVVISGSNYDTLEYSYNGIEYFPYTKPLEITRSRSVYAKGKNSFGETIEKLNITTAIAPTPIEKLDVAITLTPEEKDLEELIDRVEVTINYDERATSKYYRLGSGDLIPYTGPFTVEENTTIYAYAISDNGSGSARKQINYLTTGIANPIINVIPTTPNSWVRVEIEYASTASVKKYKLDDGEWLDYTMPIELVTNNTKVYAYNEDTLGHHEESSYLIDNIIPKENISVLDNGMYYLIRLNYPSSSNPSDREYKWRKDGIWKKYDEKGILIIRPEYKDKVIGADGVKIIDSNGKEIIIKDHYYVLDVPLSEMAENLFMRWNLDKPSTPTFTLSTEDWTKEVTIAINYDNSSVERLYKIVYEDGEDTGWLDYKEPVVIDKNNAIIYAKSINDVEIQSEIGSKKITNIDIEKPIISDVNVIKKGSSNFTIEVDALDEISKVDVYMYSLNNKDFETSTNNTYTFKKLKKSTEYKVYVKVRDKAGNISDTYEKTVVTDDIGEVSYLLDKEDWATEKVLTINYPSDIYNGYTYEYSLDLGETWLTYESPLGIKDNNTTVIARVVDGENIKVASSFTITKIDPVIPTISLDGLPSVISKDKEYDLPSSYTDGISGSVRTCKVPDRDNNYTNSSELPTGKYTLTCTITTGAGLSASVSKDISVSNATIKGDSVLSIIQDNNLKAGYYDFEILGTDEIYPVHLITYDGDQEWATNQTFGDASDVATASDYAQNMVIVKVNGDVTIDSGVTVGPYYNNYGGPKGFTLYVTGKLTNNGTIDNSHGAKAEGQNVYLWKNADGTYEYVPAVGAIGGASVTGYSVEGKNGTAGTGRQTGGGGSGAGQGVASGAGASGTSYSGGPGGGSSFSSKTGGNGSSVGGAGGTGPTGSSGGNYAGGGAGNPGGTAQAKGSNGTGGLLTIYANEYQNNGTISSKGSSGGEGNGSFSGGSSGGGSINIFTNQNTGIDQLGVITTTRYNEILGTISKIGGSTSEYSKKGGFGGAGTVNIGEIRNGQYYDLTEIIEQDKEAYKKSVTLEGDSILEIVSRDTIKSGYWYLSVNGEEYPAHIYVLDENQEWTENKTFGDANDVGTSNDYAQNMVIVKVNGDVTIDSGVTVSPYSNAYGGPKGFTLYVTGKLTNNGTIDNSHGGKAVGQNVYLWKNTDGTYEYVPAVGGAGGTGVSGRASNAGNAGTGRQTGGGGSGAEATYASGSGGTGTSYSGGTGGGSAFSSKTGGNGSSVGGAGGTGPTGSSGGNYAGGGAGNPGGTAQAKGSNGTGGLLTIYANEYQNNGTISSKGSSGGQGSGSFSGGSSGGGSINIFTNQNTGIDQLGVITTTRYNEILGTISKNGGSTSNGSRIGGAGGAGTVNIGEIRNGQYYDLTEIIEQDKESYKKSVTIEGESVLSILNKNDLKSGYYNFAVNNENYPAHVYVIDGNQNWTENKVFGDANDVGTSSTYAQNMVIVKVNGDLTIGSGVTVSPYYNTYGGPKGFTLYVTGKLENNGTIDNSHGAKAEGQNVYLWKNTDGTYEYVPSKGGAGGTGVSGRASNAGTAGTGRQTGGGGSGAGATYASGSGGTGTSYSGGTGGGSAFSSTAGTAGSSVGGTGGTGPTGSSGGNYAGGGAGNPGGVARVNGSNGTGGLLTIYANEYQNNGTISSKGSSGGQGSGSFSGGSSGGGSINIFYTSTYTAGKVNKNGGSTSNGSRIGGAGGAGTVTYTQIEALPVSATINDEDTISNLVPNPIIMLDSYDETSTKTVTIKYTSGFTNEYSLDYGETWIPYIDPIVVSDNLTIIARIKSGDKVLSSSTFTITKIKKEETANIEIPDEFIEGEDYTLPDTCTINGIRYNNINELSEGSYNLICELTSGIDPLVNKNIIIRKQLEE